MPLGPQFQSLNNDHAYFKIAIRGGNYTLRTRGVALEAVVVRATGFTSRTFCHCFNTFKSATFSMRAYGWDGAVALAEGWQHRMDVFCRIWLDAGADLDFVFTPLLVENLSLSTPRYQRLVDEMNDNTPEQLQVRVAYIREFIPSKNRM